MTHIIKIFVCKQIRKIILKYLICRIYSLLIIIKKKKVILSCLSMRKVISTLINLLSLDLYGKLTKSLLQNLCIIFYACLLELNKFVFMDKQVGILLMIILLLFDTLY